MNHRSVAIFVLGVCLAVEASCLADEKPTRTQIIGFLEDYRERHPLSENEKTLAVQDREKVDLVKRFGTDFSGLNLSGIDFRILERGVILSGVDFSGCDMQGVFFYGSVMNDCDFSQADLIGAGFWFCEFENANFDRVKLHQTKFAYTKLKNSVFARLDASTSKFESVRFVESNLTGTNFSGAGFEHGKRFTDSDLSGAAFWGANLRFADFHGAVLKNVDFSHADLTLVDLTDADIEGVNFHGANLKHADFSAAKGIDETKRKALEKLTGRWWYDLKTEVYGFLCVVYLPGFVAVVIAVLIFTAVGYRKDKKSRSFGIAAFLNGFALFSTFCTIMMLFSGGHPVRQMSMGNYDAWRQWMHFYPIPLFGMMLCVLVAGFMSIVFFAFVTHKYGGTRPWRLFFYQILTLTHCLYAINWLIMFMPDA